MKKLFFGCFLILCLLALSACGGGNAKIDEEALASVLGEYQAVPAEDAGEEDFVGSWWHLSVTEEGPYLSIYDNGAGNPGVEGRITALDGENLTVEWDPDYTEKLPHPGWSLDGGNLNLTYALTDGGIVLKNSGKAVEFTKEAE